MQLHSMSVKILAYDHSTALIGCKFCFPLIVRQGDGPGIS